MPLLALTASLAAQAPAPHALDAQSPASLPTTREEIEARAQRAEQEAASLTDARARAQKQAEAAALRKRLRDGDFQIGDRIAIVVESQALTPVIDTAVVREGRTIALDTIATSTPISLQGVLRTELVEYLTAQVGRYVRNPTVRATPLVRIGVLGPVGRPGYFWVPADMPISDVINVAGGAGGNARLDRTVVKRSNRELLDRKTTHQALAGGLTLGQLELRAGDEIIVGDATRTNWTRVLQGLGLVLSLTAAIRWIVRSS